MIIDDEPIVSVVASDANASELGSDDSEVENSETVILSLLSGDEYALVNPVSATVTIKDNDSQVSINATDADASEHGWNIGVMSVSRQGGDLDLPLNVRYVVAGTAQPGADYVQLAGNLTIPANASSAQILVLPINDAMTEDSETVTVTLSSDDTYVLGTPAAASVTITDDDQASTVWIMATDASATEQNEGGGLFTVGRSGGDLSVDLAVNYTIAGTATAGSDYVPLSGSVLIPAASTTATVPVVPIDDLVAESTENVLVHLSSGSYLVGNPNQATVTIADNEPQVNIVATDPNAAESGADPGLPTMNPW